VKSKNNFLRFLRLLVLLFTFKEICIEMAQIHNSLFENRRSEVFFSDPSSNEGPNLKDPKVMKKVEQMNSHGMLASNLYSKVLEFMDGEDYKSEKDTDDYI
jgi:hypothetical protein